MMIEASFWHILSINNSHLNDIILSLMSQCTEVVEYFIWACQNTISLFLNERVPFICQMLKSYTFAPCKILLANIENLCPLLLLGCKNAKMTHLLFLGAQNLASKFLMVKKASGLWRHLFDLPYADCQGRSLQ